jgi:hypothetical protein
MSDNNTEVEQGGVEGGVSTAIDTPPLEVVVATSPTEAMSPAPEGPSAEDMAAHDYQMLMPQFYDIIDFMPKKQLLRVIKAMVEYPLANDKPKFSYSSEARAFYTGMQINDCKFVLMRYVMELAKNKEAIAQLQKDLEEAKEKTSASNL